MINILNSLTNGLNEKQKLAVENPIDSCTKIVAGAGTGKTQIIARRFAKLTADLTQKGIEHPTSHILVITFTDKAANQMKERIIDVLNKNGLNSYGNDMWISTFHGFCNKILSRHSIEANLSPDFQLADENTLNEFYEKIVKTLRNNEISSIENIDKICSDLDLESSILNIENLKKLSAINTIDNIFDDIFQTIKKIKSLGITPKEFLDKTISATQNYSKILETLPYNGLSVDDYVINWQNHLRKYTDDFCKFEKDEAFANLCKKSLIISKNRSSKAEKWTPPEGLSDNITNFNEIEIYLTKVIALIYAIYQNELEIANIIDFDDLINKTIYILKNNKIIRAYYQKYFEHLIIDEFQDTNGSQLELIKLLLNPNYANITFVGDRKQSIYGFRYAQMENLEVLHNFIKEKYNKNYPEIKLDTNYRSSGHVLNAVNFVTTEHLNLDEELLPNPNSDFTEVNKFVKNSNIEDAQYSFERKEAEAKYFAAEIQKLHKEENAKYKDFAILVKSHSQSELIEKILTKYGIPSIKKTNKSYFTNPIIKNAIAALKLIQNPLNEIALARILQINNNEKDFLILKKTIDEKFQNIDKTLGTKHLNLNERIIKLYEENNLENKELKKIFDIISQLVKEKNQSSLLKLFLNFKQKINLHNSKQEIEHFRNENNLRIFEKIISDYEQTQNFTSIKKFLEYFDKISEDRNFELPNVNSTDLDAVQIMTIHASKGLEFPYTFVCAINNKKSKNEKNIVFDLQFGKKPGFGLMITKLNEKDSPKYHVYKEIWKNPREYNEAIRLFYVAVSRAKKYLNIITFDSNSGSKAAEYTKDFPNTIVKETIKIAEINPELQQLVPTVITKEKSFAQNLLAESYEENQTNHIFSFSKLNTFTKCESKFLLKYKYGFPSLDIHNKGAETGNIVHKLIYKALVFNEILDEKEIIQHQKNCNVDDVIRQNTILAYRNFLNSEYSPEKLKQKEFFVERHFDFIYKTTENEVRFIGDIDLLIKNTDNTYSIIDFKTNINIQADKENYYKQLYLYKKAIESEGFKVKSCAILSLNSNNTNETIELNDEPKIGEEFDRILESAIDCLKNDKKSSSTHNCKKCEYNYICNNN